MLNRLSIATFCVLLVGLFAVSTATAAPNRPKDPPPTDYWQDKGFILMAHQGGEDVFPPNTMFAYKKAMALGADMLDMDAWVTRDDHLVLTHNLDARSYTNLTDGMFEGRHDITDLDLAELKTLDFAYKWKPKANPPADPPFRGIATGDVPPPTGFTADDFKIPTFDEVLDEFPNTPINIELKEVDNLTPADIAKTTAAMANVLATHPGHNEDVIINSFGQEMLDAMALARPAHKSYGGSQDATIGYVAGGTISPTPVALEPPDLFQLAPAPAPPTRTVPILKPTADYDGYKIFVWGSDKDPAQETPAFYKKLIDEGADSYNTPNPIALAAYLCTAGVASPDGSPRCDQQICPEGQEGIAPNDCKPIPCPPGTVGVSPNCEPHGDPATVVKSVKITPAKKTIKAGKKIKLTVKVTALFGLNGSPIAKLKSSNRQVRLPKMLRFPGAVGTTSTVKKTITVRATRKAKGRAKITATAEGKKGIANLKIKNAKKKRKR